MTRHGSPQRPPSQACRGERTSLYRADLDPPNSDFLPKSDGAFRQRERRMKGGVSIPGNAPYQSRTATITVNGTNTDRSSTHNW